jgi:arabinofuranosyltransferase
MGAETGRDPCIRPGGLVRISLLLLLVLAVAGLFAWNVSSSYFIGDDAFISFRYADHLVRGNGLVWNVGERVEGYTNFLWVLLMAASLAIGVPPELSSNVLGIASGAALLFAVGRFSIRRNGADAGVWLLLLILATSRSFGAWCSSGLETMFFTLLVFLAFDRFIIERERGSERPYASSLLFGLACLTRPEGILFSAVAGAALLLDLIRGERRLRAVLSWGTPLALLVGAHFAFRLIYYGEWLPNTFYAKVAGLWLEQSLHYLTLFNRTYQIGWFLPLLLFAVWGGGTWVARLFLAVLSTYISYLLYIGGDRFEFRFLIAVFPYFYWLLIEGIRRITQMAPQTGRLRLALRGAAAVVGIGLLASTAWGWGRIVPLRERIGNVDVTFIGRYTSDRVRQGRFLRSLIDRGRLPADLVTAMGGVGAVPYYTRWITIDRRGLNDAKIARMPIAQRGLLGHEHDAPWEYLASRKVAVFDIFNGLVDKNLLPMKNKRAHFHDGRRLRLRAIQVEGRYMLFATFVSDEELARIFDGHEILNKDDASR